MSAASHQALARQLVRALRGRRSQVAFSRRLGFRTNVVYAWESGRRWPTARAFFDAAHRSRIDVRAALARFFPAEPAWLSSIDPTSRQGVARLLEELRAKVPVVDVARRTGKSRWAVARWLSGEAEPRLPDFLLLVDATSLRLLDFVALFVDPETLPACREAWRALVAGRKAAYETPWLPAVLHALELVEYTKLPEHETGWLAARLGIGVEEEERCIAALEATGQIRRERRRWVPTRVQTVDTRHDATAERTLKAWWASVGLERLRAGAPGQFSFNVFTVSKADLERLRELHRNYFRSLRSIVASSAPAEAVVVANVQLFALDDAPA